MGANPAFERTAASAIRLLAVPSSLRSSAAAQRERSVAPQHARVAATHSEHSPRTAYMMGGEAR